MERIKEAVEKARQSRNALRGASPNAVPLLADSPARSHRVSFPANITYAKTKIAAISPELLRKNRVIDSLREKSPAANSYKLLRTQVLQRLTENHWTSLGVTSAVPGEGKTLTAINLAISLAAEGNHTVLLVDFDLGRPAVASCFGYEPVCDLSKFLFSDHIPLSDVLFNPGIERLVILPGNTPIANSSETLLSPKISMLVDDIKTRYASRIVIFDLPPLLGTDDVLAFSPFLDCALLVIEEGRTRRDEVMQSMELLQTVNVIGTVLNKAVDSQRAYY